MDAILDMHRLQMDRVTVRSIEFVLNVGLTVIFRHSLSLLVTQVYLLLSCLEI